MEDWDRLFSKQVFIIAEIGCNHNGDMGIAKQLIEVAAAAGADAAKFQSFNPQEMIIRDAPKASYQILATGIQESQYQRLERLTLTPDAHYELKSHCDHNQIIFCSSCFDHQSVDLLNDMDVPFYKIPSGEITNLPLLEHIGSFGKPIILSTGMADMGEIEDALNVIGTKNRKNVALMHCLSDYPAKWHDANLRAIQTLKSAFRLPVGFSDHTKGFELALISIGLGARIIEKHITLDKNMEGGDHKASSEPQEFEKFVDIIREAEVALGDGIKRCMPSEKNVKNVARKSIVTKKSVKKDDIFTEDALAIKRPGTGIPPKYIDMIIGARATESIQEDQIVTWHKIDLKEEI